MWWPAGPNTLRNSRAVRLEPSENKILAPTLPSSWPSPFLVPLRVFRASNWSGRPFEHEIERAERLPPVPGDQQHRYLLGTISSQNEGIRPYSQELQTPLCTCRDVWNPRRSFEKSGCRGRCNESGRQLPQLSSPEREPHDHQRHQPDADLQHGDRPERDILERVPADGAKQRLVPRGAGGIHHQEHDPHESQIPSGD